MTAHVLHDLFVFLATAYIDELPDYITVFWLTAELILAIFGFYLIRKSKRAEILALWDKKWNRDQKQDWKQAEAEDSSNGHDYVDLGLSVKWATMNVGAAKINDQGSYFAWGETENKDDYTWSTYKHGTSADDLTKYNFTDNL